MGIFSKMFGEKEESNGNKSSFNWIDLANLCQIDEIKEASKTNTVLIYKHSTRCGISKMVIKQFERLFTDEHKSFKVYYLDLLNHRDISNKLAEVFEVVHQSPQVLVIKNETCVFHDSHDAIAEINLSRFL
ncbi:bacillithiol system redox-active protein YtxJ [Polaribacter sp.]|uniref:bacillithiol system redox-active protein YtxJ n=1 Tax=Polaribacter sp. TaxID=1920175 RepID=UPI003F6AC5F1